MPARPCDCGCPTGSSGGGTGGCCPIPGVALADIAGGGSGCGGRNIILPPFWTFNVNAEATASPNGDVACEPIAGLCDHFCNILTRPFPGGPWILAASSAVWCVDAGNWLSGGSPNGWASVYPPGMSFNLPSDAPPGAVISNRLSSGSFCPGEQVGPEVFCADINGHSQTPKTVNGDCDPATDAIGHCPYPDRPTWSLGINCFAGNQFQLTLGASLTAAVFNGDGECFRVETIAEVHYKSPIVGAADLQKPVVLQKVAGTGEYLCNFDDTVTIHPIGGESDGGQTSSSSGSSGSSSSSSGGCNGGLLREYLGGCLTSCYPSLPTGEDVLVQGAHGNNEFCGALHASYDVNTFSWTWSGIASIKSDNPACDNDILSLKIMCLPWGDDGERRWLLTVTNPDGETDAVPIDFSNPDTFSGTASGLVSEWCGGTTLVAGFSLGVLPADTDTVPLAKLCPNDLSVYCGEGLVAIGSFTTTSQVPCPTPVTCSLLSWDVVNQWWEGPAVITCSSVGDWNLRVYADGSAEIFDYNTNTTIMPRRNPIEFSCNSLYLKYHWFNTGTDQEQDIEVSMAFSQTPCL